MFSDKVNKENLKYGKGTFLFAFTEVIFVNYTVHLAKAPTCSTCSLLNKENINYNKGTALIFFTEVIN